MISNKIKQNIEKLQNWFAQVASPNVSIQITYMPKADCTDDYWVVCTLEFIPKNLAYAYCSVDFEETGCIGFCFETQQRVYARLGKSRQSPRIITGFEPHRVDFKRIIELVEAVSRGKLGISYSWVPVFGEYNFNVVAEKETIMHSLYRIDPKLLDKPLKNHKHVLEFLPW